MHDIGKIGMPDAVLKKPGGFTPEERAVMNQHPSIGAEILGRSRIPLFQLAAEVALSHHERWDGSGYPCAAGRRGDPAVGPHRRRGRLLRCADHGPLLPTRLQRRQATWRCCAPNAAGPSTRSVVDCFLDHMPAT